MELNSYDESTDITDEQCDSPTINKLNITRELSNPLVYNKGMPKDDASIIILDFPKNFKKLALKQTKEMKSQMVTYNPKLKALQDEIKMEGPMVKQNNKFSSTKILCVMSKRY